MRCRNFENDEVVFFGSKGIANLQAEYQEVDINKEPIISGTTQNQSFKIVGVAEKINTIKFYDAYGMLMHEILVSELPLNALPNIPVIDDAYTCSWSRTLAEVNQMTSGGYVKCITESVSKYYYFVDSQTQISHLEECYKTTIIPIEKFRADTYKYVVRNKSTTESVTIAVKYPDNQYGATTDYIVLNADSYIVLEHTFTEDTYGNIEIYVPIASEIYVGGGEYNYYGTNYKTNFFNIIPALTEQDIENERLNSNSLLETQEVRLGQNVYVYEDAFAEYHVAPSMTKCVIPEGITIIGDYAFYNAMIESFNMPNSVISELSSQGQQIFELFASSRIKSIVSGNGIEAFQMYSFYGCDELENVVLTENTKAIEYNEYTGCFALENIEIPYGCLTISQGFVDTKIKILNIPDSVNEYTIYPFASMEYLTKLKIPVCNYDYTQVNIGRLFDETTEQADVPSGYTKIEQNSNYYLIPSSLTNLTITQGYFSDYNNTITHEIPASNCENMTTLVSITIGKDITRINANAFKGCTNLRYVNLENSSTIIDPTAFDDCPSLYSIVKGKQMVQIILTTLENDEEKPSQMIDFDGEYTGVLNAPLYRAIVSDTEAYGKIIMYLYRYSTKASAENFVDKQNAVASALNEMLRVIKGELWYNVIYGIPLFDKVASKIQMDTAVMDIVNSHKEVVMIENFTSYITKNTYSCSMNIKTIYGDIAISI